VDFAISPVGLDHWPLIYAVYLGALWKPRATSLLRRRHGPGHQRAHRVDRPPTEIMRVSRSCENALRRGRQTDRADASGPRRKGRKRAAVAPPAEHQSPRSGKRSSQIAPVLQQRRDKRRSDRIANTHHAAGTRRFRRPDWAYLGPSGYVNKSDNSRTDSPVRVLHASNGGPNQRLLKEPLRRLPGRAEVRGRFVAIDSAFIELGGITRSRIVDELGAIAFANIGQVLTWGDEIQEIREGDTYFINGKEHLAKDCITRVIRQRVRVLPIATMDTSVSRVISEVSQTAKGSVKVKMHDKLAALDKLARALGMYQPIEDAGNNARSMVAVNIYEGRPASRARRDEPAFGLVGHDRDESD